MTDSPSTPDETPDTGSNDASGDKPGSGGSDGSGAKRRRWLPWVAGIGGVVVLLALAVGYLGYLASSAKSDIETARTAGTAAKDAMIGGDVEKAKSEAAAANTAAQSAHDATSNPVWSVAAAIPWLGSPLKSTQQMTTAVSDLTSKVLVPSADLTETISPATLRGPNNTINLAKLSAAQPQLNTIATDAQQIDQQVSQIPGSWLSSVSDAQQQLAEQVGETTRFAQGTDVAAKLVPTMLGGQGPRSYLLAFQTPTEARGTGGVIGGFGIIEADKGGFEKVKLAPNTELTAPASVNLGDEFNNSYSLLRPTTFVPNANLSAHFPYAAQILMSMWQNQSGQKLDGALAIDPIALSYILKVTGPVKLPDGETITADNVVPITLSSSYVRFANDNTARKEYLQTIAAAVFDKLSSSNASASGILNALGRGVSENRIMIYSSHPEEQKVLETTNLAHTIDSYKGPFAYVLVRNQAGNKIDYYLKREITYTAGSCDGPSRDSTVTVKLTNTLDDLSLPDYVIGNLGVKSFLTTPKGTNFANVQLLSTTGSKVTKIEVNGEERSVISTSELDHPSARTTVFIPPGKTATITYHLTEPTSATGPAKVPVQPLVDQPTVKVDVPECS